MALLSAVEKGHKAWNTSNTNFSKNHHVQTISALAKLETLSRSELAQLTSARRHFRSHALCPVVNKQ